METEFVSLHVIFRSSHDLDELAADINLGAIYLMKDGREWMLDIRSSEYSILPDRSTLVECHFDTLEEAKETFPDCDFNLTDLDIAERNLETAEMYLTFEDDAKTDYESDVESITLNFKQGGCTYCLEIESEMFEIVE